jgi:hypothetical protein
MCVAPNQVSQTMRKEHRTQQCIHHILQTTTFQQSQVQETLQNFPLGSTMAIGPRHTRLHHIQDCALRIGDSLKDSSLIGGERS